jgi:hypothetical protein
VRTHVVVHVQQARHEIAVDGELKPDEWPVGETGKGLAMDADYRGRPVRFSSRAWLAHDGTRIYVAVRSAVDPDKELSTSNQWGKDDAVEIALRDVTGQKPGPTFVLRGYPSGHCESSTESGIKYDTAKRAGNGMRFAARQVKPGRWDAEWSVPLEALGIAPPRPAREPRMQFNVTVRKAASGEWVMWQPTGGNSWWVDRAGTIVLQLPGGG